MRTTILFILLLLSTSGALAATLVAKVVRIQGQVEASSDSGVRTLAASSPVYSADTLLTGPQARILLRFRDGQFLTLGASTEMKVIRYQERNAQDSKRTLLEMVRGVFRATATLADPKDAFEVSTPVATIGIRGTDFWGGFLFKEGALDVLMIDGKGVYVKNLYSQVELTEAGLGTTIQDTRNGPTAPLRWGQKKVNEAVRSVSFSDS